MSRQDPEARRRLLETLCTDCALKLIARRGAEGWRRWFERLVRKACGVASEGQGAAESGT